MVTSLTVRRSRILLLFASLAVWPAWLRHIRYGVADFPLGLLLLGALAVWYVRQQRCIDPAEPGSLPALGLSWMALALYICTYNLVPPLGRGIIALEAIGLAMLASFPAPEAKRRVALLALLPLTLPLEMALQFVLGYPLRRLVTVAASVLLSPYGAEAHGTMLSCGPRILEVDNACSGILGLWTFLIIGAAAALLLRQSVGRLCITLGIAVLASLVYNLLRTTLLFMHQFHLGPESNAMHTMIGLFALAVTAVAYVTFVSRLRLTWSVDREAVEVS